MKQTKIVPVLAADGTPLMPTTHGYARVLIARGKAVVVKQKIFTIQLLYEHKPNKEEIKCELKVDSGFANIGYSVVANNEELIGGEVELLTGMSARIATKGGHKTQRNGRKRYRKPRFDNRKRKDDWLPPSNEHKNESHFKLIDLMCLLYPVNHLKLEAGNFDMKKLKNPEIHGKQYQESNLDKKLNPNLRLAILYRDDYKCQCCGDSLSKNKNIKLEVHHIVYRSKGGSDSEANLVTLCTKCHTAKNHQEGGILYEWMLQKKSMGSLKEATYMNILASRLKQRYPQAEICFGYDTAEKRKELGLAKTHHNDAFVVGGGVDETTKRVESPTNFKQKRRHDRSLATFHDAKYVDMRNGKEKKAAELNCGRTKRNKNFNGENQRAFRGKKVSKGRVTHCLTKYPIEAGDIISHDGKLYISGGNSNKGAYIRIVVDGKNISLKSSEVKVVKRNRGTYITTQPSRACLNPVNSKQVC